MIFTVQDYQNIYDNERNHLFKNNPILIVLQKYVDRNSGFIPYIKAGITELNLSIFSNTNTASPQIVKIIQDILKGFTDSASDFQRGGFFEVEYEGYDGEIRNKDNKAKYLAEIILGKIKIKIDEFKLNSKIDDELNNVITVITNNTKIEFGELTPYRVALNLQLATEEHDKKRNVWCSFSAGNPTYDSYMEWLREKCRLEQGIDGVDIGKSARKV